MAELILNSTTKPLRRRPDHTQLLLLLMATDIHLNPGPTAKYPCPVCARDVISRGVCYRCTRCSGWVHAKCSGLLNAAPYRRNKDWTCDPCSASKPINQHHPHRLQPLLHLPNKNRYLPTDCQRDEKFFRSVILKSASHHTPSGRHRLHEESVLAEILDVMTTRDDFRKRDPTSPQLPRLNFDIQNRIYAHKKATIERLC